MGRLDQLDLGLKLSKSEEAEWLKAGHERLAALRLGLAGKLGGDRLGAPDEQRHHFLHGFWPPLPGWGGMAVFDRSWYGRVLVERVEGFASDEEWERAYEEIDGFERSLAQEGMVLIKRGMRACGLEPCETTEMRQKVAG